MKNIHKKILILLTIACFATQSTEASCYALRPVSSGFGSETYATFKNGRIKEHDDDLKAFKAWMASLSTENLRNAVYSLGILKQIISALKSNNPHILTGIAKIIQSMDAANLLHRDSIGKYIPTDMFIKNLQSNNEFVFASTAEAIKYFINTGIIKKKNIQKEISIKRLLNRLQNDSPDHVPDRIVGTVFLLDVGLLGIKRLKNHIPFKLLKANLKSKEIYKIKDTIKAIKALVNAGLIDKKAFRKQIPLPWLISSLQSNNSSVLKDTVKTIKYLIDIQLLDKKTIRKYLLPQLLSNLPKNNICRLDNLCRLSHNAETVKHLINAGLIDKKSIEGRVNLKPLIINLKTCAWHSLKDAASAISSFADAGLIDKKTVKRSTTSTSINKGLQSDVSYTIIYALNALESLANAGVLDKKIIDGNFVGNLIHNLQTDNIDLLTEAISAIKALVKAGLLDKEILLCGIDFQKTVKPVPEEFRYYYMRLIEKLYKYPEKAYNVFNYLNPVLLDTSEAINNTEEEDFFYGMLARKIREGVPANEIAVEYIKERIGLLQISLKDSGDSLNSSSMLAEIVLSKQKGIDILTPPGDFPELKILYHNQIPACSSFKDIIPKGYALACAQGRTLIYKNPRGRCLALKALKSNEDVSMLDYESRMFAYLNKYKKDLGLKSIFPSPYPIQSHRIIKVKPDTAAAEALFNQVNKDGHRYELNIKNGYYTFMAYETINEAYFTYLRNSAIPPDKFQEALSVNLQDLFTLAKYGIIHTDLIELFHNTLMTNRNDGGKYLWMVDIIRPMQRRAGAGRLHAWTKTVEYPNMRLSGIADFSGIYLLKDLAEDDNPLSEHMHTFRNRHPEYNSEVFYLASYLGDYLLSAALVIGRRLRDRCELNWREPAGLSGLMEDCYVNAFSAFSDRPEHEIRLIAETINWDRFAMQMPINMAKGDKLVDYLLNKNIPWQIYGPNVIIDYADNYNTSRKWLDTPEKKGWYFDNKNPDLGPVNGPNPLQELIKANYIFTAFCLTGKSSHLAYKKPAEKQPVQYILLEELKNELLREHKNKITDNGKNNKSLLKKYLNLHPNAAHIVITGNRVKNDTIHTNVKTGKLYFVKVETLTLPENLPEGVVEYLPFGRFILEERGAKKHSLKSYYYDGPALSINGRTVKRKGIIAKDIVNTVYYKEKLDKVLVISYAENAGKIDTVSLPAVYATRAVHAASAVNGTNTNSITSVAISNNGKRRITATTGDDWYHLYCKGEGAWRANYPRARDGSNMLDNISMRTFAKTSSSGKMNLPSAPEQIIDTLVTKCEIAKLEIKNIISGARSATPDLMKKIEAQQLNIKKAYDECKRRLIALNNKKYNSKNIDKLRNAIADVIMNNAYTFSAPILLVQSGVNIDYSEIEDMAKALFKEIDAFRFILEAKELDNIERYWKPSHFDISALPDRAGSIDSGSMPLPYAPASTLISAINSAA